MPNDVKAILSVVTLLIAGGYAYWEKTHGIASLFWLIVGFAVFSVVAMWLFPEATAGKPRQPKSRV